MTETAPKKRGRRTKVEELREAFVATGSDLAKLDEFLDGALTAEPAEVPSAHEIRDELLRILYERRGELKGIALVNGLKALASLAATEEAAGQKQQVEDDRRPILDRIDALPKDHARKLLKQELARVDGYRADLFAALEGL